ncbi:MAG: PilZ domain-containing protein, partial [Hydrogenovibrio crunogenus]|nr:PilZ domain-containing protein [Hydrogenovibrio crunogenus]
LSSEEAKKQPIPPQADSNYIEKHFMNNLAELDEQINTIVSQIGQKSTLLATALTALNSKLDFLLHTVDKKQLVHAIPQQMVNISAGGVAIKVNEPVTETDKVDLLIQPLEEEPPILVRCSIVKIIPDKDIATASTVALEYENLSEDDRRKLVYFIQSKEIEMANKQKQ